MTAKRKDPDTIEEWTVNLDEKFRPDSAARAVAERLLTGKPQTRSQLVEGLGISVTTVNRVAEMLEELGAHMRRETAPDGKQALFMVVDVGPAPSRSRFPALNEDLEITGARKIGDQTVIDLTSGESHYRGELKTLMRMIPLGKRLRVETITAAGEGLADLRLVSDDSQVISVEAVRNVTT